MNLSEIGQSPISPQKLYMITKERGFDYTDQLFRNLTYLERNIISKGTFDLSQIKHSGTNLSSKVLDLLTLFHPFLCDNVNYLYYIIILDSFTTEQLSNWYRFTLVHWNRLLSNLSLDDHSLSTHSFLYSWKEINETMEIGKLEEMICLSLIYFVNLSGKKGNKLCVFFLLNTIKQYIIP